VKRILALDVGSVRIGVALSDPMGIIAQPLEVIDRRRGQALARIAELVASYEVSGVVVGKPLTLRGEAGLAVEAIDAFVAELSEAVEVPITWWDERLSTAQAERAMIAGGVRRGDRRQRIDKVAAALILQSYLDAQRP
jgi:putative Holliday junction resolvase